MDPLGSLAILNSSDGGDLSSNALLKIPPRLDDRILPCKHQQSSLDSVDFAPPDQQN